MVIIAMSEICYLCGKEILKDDIKNNDHVFPKQFIKRKHPKSKGFDYLGILPTHKDCNSKFGDSNSGAESMVKKSLKLIHVLFNPNSHIVRQYKKNSNIKVFALNSEYLKNFSSKDFKFFQFTDVRNIDYDNFTSPGFLNAQKSVKPFDKSTNVCLSVLAKSAAAILIKRESINIPNKWIIAAYPGFIEYTDINFDRLLGKTKPLETGIKYWLKPISPKNYLFVYKFESIIVFFHFAFDSDLNLKKILPDIFVDKDIVIFKGKNLLEMINYPWSEHFLDS